MSNLPDNQMTAHSGRLSSDPLATATEKLRRRELMSVFTDPELDALLAALEGGRAPSEAQRSTDGLRDFDLPTADEEQP